MHRFKNRWWRLVWSGVGGGEKTSARVHTSADEPPTRTQPSILYDQNLCVMLHMTISQTVQRSAAAFMSPPLLRYVVTANMKSGLFCQKRVNKHGNASSEGHSSISRDKCSESTVAFGLSHKMTEQTKVVADCNDLISTFFFFFFAPLSQLQSYYTSGRKEFVVQ